MSDQISDLYVLLRAETGQLIGGFAEAGVSGEEMAAKVTAVTSGVEAEIVRMNESLVSVGVAADEMAVQTAADFEAIQAKTIGVVTSFETMAAKAEESTLAISAATAKAEEATAVAAAKNVATTVKVGLGVAAAGAIVIGATAKMSGDFESATNRLVVSAGESQSSLAMVRQGILEMAGQVGDSALDLARAGYVIESMGYHGRAGLDALKAAAQGAKAENADLNTVAKGLTATMNDYGPKVGDAATVMSKLVTAVGDAGTTFEDFTGALHTILPIASSMNIPFNDIAGALAEMTAHGMSADQSAQNLANSLRSLQKPSSDQTQYLAQLGITASDLTDKLSTRGLTGTLNDIRTAIVDHMGPAGKVLISALNQSKQATQDLQVMMQNMPASLRSMAQEFLNGSITVKDWHTAVKALPADQQGMASQFATLANKADGFNNILKQGGPAAQSYTQAMQRATGNATSLNVALMLTGQNAAATNKAVTDIANSSKEADGSVKGWSEIQGTFNQKLDEAKAALSSLGIELGQIFLPVLGDFVSGLANAAKWMGEHPTLMKAIAVALGALTVAALVFAGAMVIVNIAMLPEIGIMLAITAVVLGVIAMIVELIFIVSGVVSHWSAISGFFVDLWNTIKGAFETAIGWIGNRIDDVVNWFKSLPGKIGDGLGSLGSTIGSVARNAWSSFTGYISDGVNNIIKMFKDFPEKAGYAIGFLIGTLAKKGKEAWDAFTDAISIAFSATVQWFHDLPKNIGNMVSGANSWLASPGRDMVTGWINGVNQKWEDFKKWLNDLPGNIENFFNNAGLWLYSKGMDIIRGAGNGLGDAWSGIRRWWSDTFPDGITHFFGNAINWLVNAGRDILRGLVNGISSMIGWVHDTVSGFISNLIAGVRAGFDSHSPSRVAHNIGEDFMNGLGNGINAKAGEVIALAKKTSQQVIGAATGEFQVNGTVGISGNTPGIATGIAGHGSRGGPVIINVTVQGNIRTTQQFVREMQQELLRYGIRNFGNGSTYLGFGAAS